MDSFCPDVKRPSTRFTISSEVSTSKPRGITIMDLAMGTEVHYSDSSAEELVDTMARALGRTTARPLGRMTNRL